VLDDVIASALRTFYCDMDHSQFTA
jgi:hypothetical protein